MLKFKTGTVNKNSKIVNFLVMSNIEVADKTKHNLCVFCGGNSCHMFLRIGLRYVNGQFAYLID